MRIRRNEATGIHEVYCTAGSHWVAASNAQGQIAGDALYLSTAARQHIANGNPAALLDGMLGNLRGDGYRYGVTSAFRSHCRSCEATRQRARRASGSGTSTPQTGRAFGVELELTGPGAPTIIAALRAAGIRMSTANQNGTAQSYQHTNTEHHVWTLKRDSSVHGAGLELVSPKLRGSRGMDELKTVCHALQSVGATVDRSTGCHVHVDFRNMTAAQIKTQITGVIVNQQNVFRMMAPSRRNNGYCPAWRNDQLNALRSGMTINAIQYTGPRGIVNLGSYPIHGSIEFRSHGGTTSFKKLSAWINFLMAVLAKNGMNHPDREMLFASVAEYVRYAGVSTEDAAQLLRFERAAEQLEADEYANAATN